MRALQDNWENRAYFISTDKHKTLIMQRIATS
jgi:hypothetical protein